MKKVSRLRLPQLNELILIDSTVELNENPPELELPAKVHFAGLVAVGGRFDGPTLYQAYENGIFPWPHGDQTDLWFCPVWRAVIDFAGHHIPRSLGKKLRRRPYKFTVNKVFSQVVSRCSTVPRRGQLGTWIEKDLMRGYDELHKMGFAHSLEAWQDEKLVAGIYGICVGGNFSAESMFGLERDSSKICLVRLIQWLEHSGFSFLDVQMVTPVTKSLGAKYIRRADFLRQLAKLHEHPPSLDFGFIDRIND